MAVLGDSFPATSQEASTSCLQKAMGTGQKEQGWAGWVGQVSHSPGRVAPRSSQARALAG
jgi:hypothetical protein